MPDRPELDHRFTQALESGDLDRVEECWLTALDEDPIPTAQLLEVRRLLWQAGHKTLARTLLELLAEAQEAGNDPDAALAALAEQVRLTDKPDDALVGRLEAALRKQRSGSPSLTKVLDRHPLTGSRRPLDVLKTVEQWLDHDVGTVVEVAGQGVGRVLETNLELGNLKVDVGGRRPVSVPFGAISKFVQVLPPGDFRRQVVEDPDGLRLRVHESPGETLVQLLESLDGPADVASIKAALDGIVVANEWNSWWAKARKHPRLLTSGSGSRLRYTAGATAEEASETLLDELRAADPRQRLTVARRLAARGPDAAGETMTFLTETLAGLETSEPGLAWETAAIIASLPGGADEGASRKEHLIASVSPLQLLQGIQDRAEREAALEAVRSSLRDIWPEVWSDWMLHETNPALLDRILHGLDTSGAQDAADAALEAIFRNHVAHAAQFVWACEAMVEDKAPEYLRRRLTPSLLEKLPDTLTRAEFSALRSRAKSLLDGGQVAVRLLLTAATPQQAERFVGRMNRISNVEPQRLRVLEQAATQAHGTGAQDVEELFVATRDAVEAKQKELKQLVEVDIPKTLKGINAAAAEGDLRENFEYHMLRDRQELQSARAAKLQRDLGRVRILEPGTADTSQINMGTVAHLTTSGGDPLEPVTIMGAWDADVDRRIFANGSGVGERLLGCTVGDEVEVDGVKAVISKITAWGDDLP